jgi:hypothetical protein
MTRTTLLALAICLCSGGCIIVEPPRQAQNAYAVPQDPAMARRIEQFRAANATFAQNCPLPPVETAERAVQVRAPNEPAVPITPDIKAEWVNGCAVVRFSVDETGHVTSAESITEQPTGTGAPAIDILRLNRFRSATGSPPGAPLVIRVGMAQPEGGGTLVVIGTR